MVSSDGTDAAAAVPVSSGAPSAEISSGNSQQKKSRFTVKTIVNKEEEVSADAVLTPKPSVPPPPPSTSLPPSAHTHPQESSAMQRLESGFEHLMTSHQRLVVMMQDLLSNQTALLNLQPNRTLTGSASNSSLTAELETSSSSDKDKSLARMSHYLNELRRELDMASKQRKEHSLEMKRLREKCQQLEDKLAVEVSRSAALEDRAEKNKARAVALQTQLDMLLLQQQGAHESHSALDGQPISLPLSAASRGASLQPSAHPHQTTDGMTQLSSSIADEADLRLLSST